MIATETSTEIERTLDHELEKVRGRNYDETKSRGTRIDTYHRSFLRDIAFYDIGEEKRFRLFFNVHEGMTNAVENAEFSDVAEQFENAVSKYVTFRRINRTERHAIFSYESRYAKDVDSILKILYGGFTLFK